MQQREVVENRPGEEHIAEVLLPVDGVAVTLSVQSVAFFSAFPFMAFFFSFFFSESSEILRMLP